MHQTASYLSSHDPRLHFGVGAATRVDRLEVRWLSGVVQRFENLNVNREYTIAEFSETPEDALFVAAWTGELPTRDTPHAANLDSRDGLDRTPLHIAAENGHTAVARFLIENGADVNLTDRNGNTPLIFTVHKTGDLETIQHLLEHGAAVNAQNRTGETALMYAAWRGHARIVQYLLEQGADADLKNRNAETARTLSESQGYLDIVEMLQ